MTTKTLLKTVKTLQIAVPMTDEERELFDSFIDKEGKKKGDFTRKAIIEQIKREEELSWIASQPTPDQAQGLRDEVESRR